jgi:hypothetical protein
VGGETAGGSVSGRWSLVVSAEILGCPGPMVPLGWRYVWYFGTPGLWFLWIFGFLDSIGTSGKQKDSISALLSVPLDLRIPSVLGVARYRWNPKIQGCQKKSCTWGLRESYGISGLGFESYGTFGCCDACVRFGHSNECSHYVS